MNKTSLDLFTKEVSKIRRYFKHIQHVNEILKYSTSTDDNNYVLQELVNELQKHDKTFRTDRKIFEYKASIISLYGLLEKYVEIWVKDYLDSLSTLIDDYGDIDKKIRDNHFELSLKLISIITSRENAKYQHLTKELVLDNLNRCISSPTEYTFNAESFTISSGNLKHKQIVNMFELININLNEALKKNKTIIGYIQNEQQTTNIANTKTDVLYNKINDLVERRNQVAHGSEILDILEVSELESYIRFLEKYCQAIFEVLLESFIKQESRCTFQKLEGIDQVIADKIIIFEIENFTFKVGDAIIIETMEGGFFKKHILTIQLDNQPYEEIIITKKSKIAVGIEPKIKNNQTFYMAKQNFLPK
jgi:hypothetical protein